MDYANKIFKSKAGICLPLPQQSPSCSISTRCHKILENYPRETLTRLGFAWPFGNEWWGRAGYKPDGFGKCIQIGNALLLPFGLSKHAVRKWMVGRCWVQTRWGWKMNSNEGCVVGTVWVLKTSKLELWKNVGLWNELSAPQVTQ